MLSLHPFLLLIPLLIYLAVHIFLAFMNIKHIVKTGSLSPASNALTIVFFIYTLVVLAVTLILLSKFLTQPGIAIDFGSLFNSSPAFDLNN